MNRANPGFSKRTKAAHLSLNVRSEEKDCSYAPPLIQSYE